MFKITKTFKFEAAHQLMHHDGKCRNLHGHSWVVDVEFKGEGLYREGPKKNMLIDYGDVSKYVKPIIEELDHTLLNEVLKTDSPTSEYLAQWMSEKLVNFGPAGVVISAITIHETCTSACRYEW